MNRIANEISADDRQIPSPLWLRSTSEAEISPVACVPDMIGRYSSEMIAQFLVWNYTRRHREYPLLFQSIIACRGSEMNWSRFRSLHNLDVSPLRHHRRRRRRDSIQTEPLLPIVPSVFRFYQRLCLDRWWPEADATTDAMLGVCCSWIEVRSKYNHHDRKWR